MCVDIREGFTQPVYWCDMLIHVVCSWLLQVKVCPCAWHAHVCWHMTVVMHGHVVTCCMLIYCTLSHWCILTHYFSRIDAYCIAACQHVMFYMSPCISLCCHMSVCCMTSRVNGCCLSSCLIACHHMLLSWITAAVWTQQLPQDRVSHSRVSRSLQLLTKQESIWQNFSCYCHIFQLWYVWAKMHLFLSQ